MQTLPSKEKWWIPRMRGKIRGSESGRKFTAYFILWPCVHQPTTQATEDWDIFLKKRFSSWHLFLWYMVPYIIKLCICKGLTQASTTSLSKQIWCSYLFLLFGKIHLAVFMASWTDGQLLLVLKASQLELFPKETPTKWRTFMKVPGKQRVVGQFAYRLDGKPAQNLLRMIYNLLFGLGWFLVISSHVVEQSILPC